MRSCDDSLTDAHGNVPQAAGIARDTSGPWHTAARARARAGPDTPESLRYARQRPWMPLAEFAGDGQRRVSHQSHELESNCVAVAGQAGACPNPGFVCRELRRNKTLEPSRHAPHRFQPRHPPHSFRELLRLPRAGQKQAQGRPASGSARRCDGQAGVGRTCGGAG